MSPDDGPTQTASDAWIVSLLLDGADEGLRLAYQTYARVLYGLALRVTRNEGFAEDVTQDVFVQLWQAPQRLDLDRGTLRSYLTTMTHRRAVDLVRTEQRQSERKSRHRHPVDDAIEPDISLGVIRSVESTALISAIRRAIASLPPTQWSLIELTYFDGMTYRQAAVALDVPEGTAKTRIRTAMKTLEGLLRDDVGSFAESKG